MCKQQTKTIDKLENGVPGGAVCPHSFILSRGKEKVCIDVQCRILTIVRVFVWIATALPEHRKLNQFDLTDRKPDNFL